MPRGIVRAATDLVDGHDGGSVCSSGRTGVSGIGHGQEVREGGAPLLVVRSRGRGVFTGMLLGSTIQTPVPHAPRPLLVARPNS